MLPKNTSSWSKEKWCLTKFWLMLVTLALSSIQIIAQNGWTQVSSMTPPQVSATAAVVDGKIFLIGGWSSSAGHTDINRMYDPLTGEWENKTPMPTPRGFLTSAVVDGIIYTFGGGYPNFLNIVEAYDPATDTWDTTIANMTIPRLNARAGVINGLIYVVGGAYTDRRCEYYNPQTNIWTPFQELPVEAGGGSSSITVYNGLLYSFGGGYSPTHNKVYAYDPQTDTWTEKSDMPTARCAAQSCLLNDRIYVIGGATSAATTAAVEMYDPDTDTWYQMGDMPVPSGWLSCAVVNNKIYTFEGTPDRQNSSGLVWEFVPPNIFTIESCIDKTYAKVNTDSVLFRTRFYIINSMRFTSNLIYSCWDGSGIDSLVLYDDGIHGDSLANDGIYATYIPPQSTEDFYCLSVSITEDQTLNYCCSQMRDDCKFTTAGPVTLDSISYFKGSIGFYYFRPFVHNGGNTKSISNSSIKLICNDPWIEGSAQSRPLPTLPPGTTFGPNSWFVYKVIDSLFPGYFNFKVEIMSDGCVFWIDSTDLVITGVQEEIELPSTFTLYQNYPNPFNPSTSIKFDIPTSSLTNERGRGEVVVRLKIYDILGNLVRTLKDEPLAPGSYEVEFDAGGLSSGVYFYRLNAGDFSETKKMILLR